MNNTDLPLFDPAPDPRELASHREAQLEAYKRTACRARGISFYTAVQSRPLAICLRNLAELAAKNRRSK